MLIFHRMDRRLFWLNQSALKHVLTKDNIVDWSLQVKLVVKQISEEFCGVIMIPFLQCFHKMYGVKSMYSSITVGNQSLRMLKTWVNVCFLSFRFMWVPVSSFLCPPFCLGDCFLCSWQEKWWLIVHPSWLVQWKVAVLLWWCHLSDWSDCAFQWHARIGLYQYHGRRAV